jgi:hypothetical protein
MTGGFRAWPSRELQALDQFRRDSGDAFLRPMRKGGSWLGVRIAENDPQAGAVALVTAGADGAGQLREFEGWRGRMSEIEIGVLRRVRLVGRMGKEIHENAAGVVNEVAKTLRDENGIYIAGRGLLELEKIVIGERTLERDFDGSGRAICIRRNAYGHGASSLH